MNQTFTSKSGKTITLHFPTLEDVHALWEYINMLSQERTYISYQGEEISYIEEETFLKDVLE